MKKSAARLSLVELRRPFRSELDAESHFSVLCQILNLQIQIEVELAYGDFCLRRSAVTGDEFGAVDGFGVLSKMEVVTEWLVWIVRVDQRDILLVDFVQVLRYIIVTRCISARAVEH